MKSKFWNKLGFNVNSDSSYHVNNPIAKSILSW